LIGIYWGGETNFIYKLADDQVDEPERQDFAAPALVHIQVFVLSSAASPETQAEIQNKGARYRSKPVTLKHFLELGAEIFAVCKAPVLA